jgi:DNA-directed RNA polymerase I, II, and III subunit RPABC1
MNYKEEVMKSLTTIFDMLRDRRVDGVDEAAERYSVNEISSILSSRQTFNLDIKDKVRIIFDVGSKMKSADVKKIVELDTDFALFLIVSREKAGANELKKLKELKVEFQVFDMRELQYNISKHMLVPKHELLTNDAEIEEIVNVHMLKSRHQMPIILKTDPMARYLYARPGDLVRITRHSPTSGEHVIYRCCM